MTIPLIFINVWNAQIEMIFFCSGPLLDHDFFQSRDVGAVRGIGGSADLFKQKFRATVVDDVGGEFITLPKLIRSS